MHPDRTFHWEDRDAIRAFVREIGFGMLFAAAPDGPRVVHLPTVWLDDATLGIHFARGNDIAQGIEGARALFVVNGPDGYVSPDWYGLDSDQVPTWNYVAVELEGTMRQMERAALVAQIDQLATEQEARLAPKQPWTRDKVDPARIDRMLDAIVGYRLEIAAWRASAKLGQNKPAAARLSAAQAVADAGRPAIAQWMRAFP